MTVRFRPDPPAPAVPERHHAAAAAGNLVCTQRAVDAVRDALDDPDAPQVVLLRAAAGAGKSFALVRTVAEALRHRACERVAVTAFANKQIVPLARDLARALAPQIGAGRVCLLLAGDRVATVPPDVAGEVVVVSKASQLPDDAAVVVATSHRLGVPGERKRLREKFFGPDPEPDPGPGDGDGDGPGDGPGPDDGAPVWEPPTPFDVLFVDEAWQLAQMLFTRVRPLARTVVGVGDVGQLPPLDPGANPWRGDPGHNPYRAWPTAYEDRPGAVTLDLPAVWRPCAGQLPLWRAFYTGFERLDGVAAPGDRTLVPGPVADPDAAAVWARVATGRPVLLEVEGLAEPEAPDVDGPLLGVLGGLLDELLTAGVTVGRATYGPDGGPAGHEVLDPRKEGGDPLVVVLATRNRAVDDAHDLVQALRVRHGLPEGVVLASTVDSWQGQTNRITVALHPLSGARRLDDFNSAFGRLAVTCTRATHGLLVLSRAGLDGVLARAAARPGAPFGEPGTRTLPRQTHQRILNAFTRGTLHLDDPN